jgi:hypothetical protein
MGESETSVLAGFYGMLVVVQWEKATIVSHDMVC